MDIDRLHSWEPSCEELPYDPEYSEDSVDTFFLDSSSNSVNINPLQPLAGLLDEAA